MHSDDSNPVPRQNQTFWQRHALTIILLVMALLFAVVIVAQVQG
jgi:hypothetical protein